MLGIGRLPWYRGPNVIARSPGCQVTRRLHRLARPGARLEPAPEVIWVCALGQGTRVRVTDNRALRFMRRLAASLSWPVPRTPLEYRERESYDRARVSGGSSLCLSPSKGVGRYEVHVLARRRLPRLRLNLRGARPKRL